MIPWWVAVLIGLGALVLIEIRLRAMRDLFRLSMIQRESFDTAIRTQGDRIAGVADRMLEEFKARDLRLNDHETRIKTIEGRIHR